MKNTIKTTEKPILNREKPIFWKGNLCKMIFWETLNFGGELKIKIKTKKILIKIDELTN